MDGTLRKCFPSMKTGLFMDGTLRRGLRAVKMRVFYGRKGGWNSGREEGTYSG